MWTSTFSKVASGPSVVCGDDGAQRRTRQGGGADAVAGVLLPVLDHPNARAQKLREFRTGQFALGPKATDLVGVRRQNFSHDPAPRNGNLDHASRSYPRNAWSGGFARSC